MTVVNRNTLQPVQEASESSLSKKSHTPPEPVATNLPEDTAMIPAADLDAAVTPASGKDTSLSGLVTSTQEDKTTTGTDSKAPAGSSNKDSVVPRRQHSLDEDENSLGEGASSHAKSVVTSRCFFCQKNVTVKNELPEGQSELSCQLCLAKKGAEVFGLKGLVPVSLRSLTFCHNCMADDKKSSALQHVILQHKMENTSSDLLKQLNISIGKVAGPVLKKTGAHETAMKVYMCVRIGGCWNKVRRTPKIASLRVDVKTTSAEDSVPVSKMIAKKKRSVSEGALEQLKRQRQDTANTAVQPKGGLLPGSPQINSPGLGSPGMGSPLAQQPMTHFPMMGAAASFNPAMWAANPAWSAMAKLQQGAAVAGNAPRSPSQTGSARGPIMPQFAFMQQQPQPQQQHALPFNQMQFYYNQSLPQMNPMQQMFMPWANQSRSTGYLEVQQPATSMQQVSRPGTGKK